MSTALLHHILSKRAQAAPVAPLSDLLYPGNTMAARMRTMIAGMPASPPAPTGVPLKPMGAEEKAALFMPRRPTPTTTSAIKPSGMTPGP